MHLHTFIYCINILFPFFVDGHSKIASEKVKKFPELVSFNRKFGAKVPNELILDAVLAIKKV